MADLGEELAEKYRGRAPVLWGENLPGVVRTIDGSPVAHTARGGARAKTPGTTSTQPPRPAPTLALTLDACDGTTDTRIIALLRRHGVPATVFVTSRWLRRNAAIAQELAADPLFALACHGKRHKPASVDGRQVYGIKGTRSIPALVEEVEDNARAIAAVTGTRPAWYRSGTAHYDDVAIDVIHDLGLGVAGFLVSADQGATLAPGEVYRRMVRAPDKAIILCHLNHPESGTYRGLARAIPFLLEQGATFVPLDDAGGPASAGKAGDAPGVAGPDAAISEHKAE